MLLSAISLLVAFTNAQPMTVSGQTTSTACTTGITTCSSTGSSNYVSRSLTYNPSTGKFSGTMISNQCSNNAWGRNAAGEQMLAGAHRPSCIQQTFPAPAYANGPAAAPLRGVVGYSLWGVDIYGPFEAGFTLGQACTNGKGSCAAGLDLAACEAKITTECGAAYVQNGMLIDSCGGHADTYHYHKDLACDYSRITVNASNHSPLLGIALDGYGIYGIYEDASTKTAPTLDACGGHVGPVPAIAIAGTSESYPAANVYHYHLRLTPPFTLGCYGPVSSLTQCQSLYATCNTGYTDVFTSTTYGCKKNYDTDCPCFQHGNTTYNQFSSADCVGLSVTTTTTVPTGSNASRLVSTVAVAVALFMLSM